MHFIEVIFRVLSCIHIYQAINQFNFYSAYILSGPSLKAHAQYRSFSLISQSILNQLP